MNALERFYEEIKHLELNPIIEESEVLRALEWLKEAYENNEISYAVCKLLSDPIQMSLNYYIEKDRANYSS